MRTLRLHVRAPVTLLSLAAVLVALVLLGVRPDVDRLAPLALLGLLVAVLVWELLPDRSARWELARREPPRPAGQDAGTASWVRLLEAHQSMGRPDAALRDRLRATVEDLLRVRRGVSLAALAPAQRTDMLGSELEQLLYGPPARVTSAALLDHLERIERL